LFIQVQYLASSRHLHLSKKEIGNEDLVYGTKESILLLWKVILSYPQREFRFYELFYLNEQIPICCTYVVPTQKQKSPVRCTRLYN